MVFTDSLHTAHSICCREHDYPISAEENHAIHSVQWCLHHVEWTMDTKLFDMVQLFSPSTYLTCSLIGAHLQANGSLVIWLLRLSLWVIKMPSGAISSHASLTGTFICPHLHVKGKKKKVRNGQRDVLQSKQPWINGVGGKLHTLWYKNASATHT